MTAPTTRETADHAEMARLAEDKADAHIRNLRLAASRDFAVSGYSDGLIVEQDMRGMLLAAAETFDALLSEIAALRGERTFLMEQKEGAEDAIFDALTRLTQAERQRDELRKALEEIARATPTSTQSETAHDMAEWSHCRAVVALCAATSIANQGADQ